MGSVLKNLYTKQLKEKLAKLSRDQCIEYLRNGKITVDGVEIQEGWMKITKKFNDSIKQDPTVGSDCNVETSVLLDLRVDENLKSMGVAREIVNKI